MRSGTRSPSLSHLRPESASVLSLRSRGQMTNRLFPQSSTVRFSAASRWVCATLLGVLMLGSTSDSYTLAQRPQDDRLVAVITDYQLPPTTLDAAWDKAPVIVLARVQSSTRREQVGPSQMRMPLTEHQIALVEVFKGAERLGSANTLVITQDSVEESASPSAVTHSSGGRVFKASEEYVFFLEPNPGQTSFGVAWGSGGAYKVGALTVDVPDVARRMWLNRDELGRLELLSALRTKRDKRHGK